MREIGPSHVKETSFTCSLVINWIQKSCLYFRMFERSCLRQRRLFTFVRHYDSCAVSCGMLTKVCKARINLFETLSFLHYSLTAWSHIFTGCNQGGKVTFGNTHAPLTSRTGLVIGAYNASAAARVISRQWWGWWNVSFNDGGSRGTQRKLPTDGKQLPIFHIYMACAQSRIGEAPGMGFNLIVTSYVFHFSQAAVFLPTGHVGQGRYGSTKGLGWKLSSPHLLGANHLHALICRHFLIWFSTLRLTK